MKTLRIYRGTAKAALEAGSGADLETAPPSAPTPESPDAPHVSGRSRRRRVALVVLGTALVVALLAVAADGLLTYWRSRNEFEMEVRRRWLSWNQQKRSIDERCREIQKLASKAAPRESKAHALLGKANTAVADVLSRAPRTPSVPPPPPSNAPPPGGVSRDAVIKASLKVREHAAAVSTGVRELKTIADEMAKLRARVKRRIFVRLPGDANTLDPIAKQCADELAAAGRLEENSRQELAQAQSALSELVALKKKWAQVEAERQRQAEAARAEAARLAKLKKELEVARNVVKAAKSMFPQWQFKEALRILNARRSDLDTEEARSVLAPIIDRYSRLSDLKSFLVKQLNSDPFAWGWDYGQFARDVLGADDAGVRLADRAIPWKDVDARQLRKFIDHYLAYGRLNPVKTAKLKLAAAIYFQEAGLPEVATQYAADAVRDYDGVKQDADRLLKTE